MMNAKFKALEIERPSNYLDSFQAGVANNSDASGDTAADFLNIDLDFGFY